MIQPSQMSYPPYEKASQIPKTIVPTPPIAAAAFPIFAERLHPDRLRRRVGAPDRDDQDPEEDESQRRTRTRSDVQREKPVVEAHARDPRTMAQWIPLHVTYAS